jgi:16S rRNA (guanine(966)-N(2))-methyltransferase RsmD
MRIVGGEHRGRKLVAPEGAATRPTSEKVREALFDILGERIAGAVFGDLFAGTGAVGLEALSRGASSCVFVESRSEALEALQRNIEFLRVVARSRVIAVDAARALDLLESGDKALDFCFCDPPYADASWPLLLAGMGARAAVAPGGFLVVEHAIKTPPACPAGMEQGRTYKYGDTGLTVFKKGDQVIR